jgi:hypothetical protein
MSDCKMRPCSRCGKIRKVIRKYVLCKQCSGMVRAIINKPDLMMSPHILIKDTINTFGYNPLHLRHSSNKLVMVQCMCCGKKRAIKKSVSMRSEWCFKCRGKDTQRKWTEAKRKYVDRAEKDRAYKKRQYLVEKSDPIKNMSHRIKSSLGSAYKRKGNVARKPYGCFRLLGYTKSELVRHLETCLLGGCVICREPINDKWHITHLKPVAHAKSPEEVLQLFQLKNLSVAHPICNIRLGATDISESHLMN